METPKRACSVPPAKQKQSQSPNFLMPDISSQVDVSFDLPMEYNDRSRSNLSTTGEASPTYQTALQTSDGNKQLDTTSSYYTVRERTKSAPWISDSVQNRAQGTATGTSSTRIPTRATPTLNSLCSATGSTYHTAVESSTPGQIHLSPFCHTDGDKSSNRIGESRNSPTPQASRLFFSSRRIVTADGITSPAATDSGLNSQDTFGKMSPNLGTFRSGSTSQTPPYSRRFLMKKISEAETTDDLSSLQKAEIRTGNQNEEPEVPMKVTEGIADSRTVSRKKPACLTPIFRGNQTRDDALQASSSGEVPSEMKLAQCVSPTPNFQAHTSEDHSETKTAHVPETNLVASPICELEIDGWEEQYILHSIQYTAENIMVSHVQKQLHSLKGYMSFVDEREADIHPASCSKWAQPSPYGTVTATEYISASESTITNRAMTGEQSLHGNACPVELQEKSYVFQQSGSPKQKYVHLVVKTEDQGENGESETNTEKDSQTDKGFSFLRDLTIKVPCEDRPADEQSSSSLHPDIDSGKSTRCEIQVSQEVTISDPRISPRGKLIIEAELRYGDAELEKGVTIIPGSQTNELFIEEDNGSFERKPKIISKEHLEAVSGESKTPTEHVPQIRENLLMLEEVKQKGPSAEENNVHRSGIHLEGESSPREKLLHVPEQAIGGCLGTEQEKIEDDFGGNEDLISRGTELKGTLEIVESNEDIETNEMDAKEQGPRSKSLAGYKYSSDSKSMSNDRVQIPTDFTRTEHQAYAKHPGSEIALTNAGISSSKLATAEQHLSFCNQITPVEVIKADTVNEMEESLSSVMRSYADREVPGKVFAQDLGKVEKVLLHGESSTGPVSAVGPDDATASAEPVLVGTQTLEKTENEEYPLEEGVFIEQGRAGGVSVPEETQQTEELTKETAVSEGIFGEKALPDMGVSTKSLSHDAATIESNEDSQKEEDVSEGIPEAIDGTCATSYPLAEIDQRTSPISVKIQQEDIQFKLTEPEEVKEIEVEQTASPFVIRVAIDYEQASAVDPEAFTDENIHPYHSAEPIIIDVVIDMVEKPITSQTNDSVVLEVIFATSETPLLEIQEEEWDIAEPRPYLSEQSLARERNRESEFMISPESTTASALVLNVPVIRDQAILTPNKPGDVIFTSRLTPEKHLPQHSVGGKDPIELDAMTAQETDVDEFGTHGHGINWRIAPLVEIEKSGESFADGLNLMDTNKEMIQNTLAEPEELEKSKFKVSITSSIELTADLDKSDKVVLSTEANFKESESQNELNVLAEPTVSGEVTYGNVKGETEIQVDMGRNLNELSAGRNLNVLMDIRNTLSIARNVGEPLEISSNMINSELTQGQKGALSLAVSPDITSTEGMTSPETVIAVQVTPPGVKIKPGDGENDERPKSDIPNEKLPCEHANPKQSSPVLVETSDDMGDENRESPVPLDASISLVVDHSKELSDDSSWRASPVDLLDGNYVVEWVSEHRKSPALKQKSQLVDVSFRGSRERDYDLIQHEFVKSSGQALKGSAVEPSLVSIPEITKAEPAKSTTSTAEVNTERNIPLTMENSHELIKEFEQSVSEKRATVNVKPIQLRERNTLVHSVEARLTESEQAKQPPITSKFLESHPFIEPQSNQLLGEGIASPLEVGSSELLELVLTKKPSHDSMPSTYYTAKSTLTSMNRMGVTSFDSDMQFDMAVPETEFVDYLRAVTSDRTYTEEDKVTVKPTKNTSPIQENPALDYSERSLPRAISPLSPSQNSTVSAPSARSSQPLDSRLMPTPELYVQEREQNKEFRNTVERPGEIRPAVTSGPGTQPGSIPTATAPSVASDNVATNSNKKSVQLELHLEFKYPRTPETHSDRLILAEVEEKYEVQAVEVEETHMLSDIYVQLVEVADGVEKLGKHWTSDEHKLEMAIATAQVGSSEISDNSAKPNSLMLAESGQLRSRDTGEITELSQSESASRTKSFDYHTKDTAESSSDATQEKFTAEIYRTSKLSTSPLKDTNGDAEPKHVSLLADLKENKKIDGGRTEEATHFNVASKFLCKGETPSLQTPTEKMGFGNLVKAKQEVFVVETDNLDTEALKCLDDTKNVPQNGLDRKASSILSLHTNYHTRLTRSSSMSARGVETKWSSEVSVASSSRAASSMSLPNYTDNGYAKGVVVVREKDIISRASPTNLRAHYQETRRGNSSVGRPSSPLEWSLASTVFVPYSTGTTSSESAAPTSPAGHKLAQRSDSPLLVENRKIRENRLRDIPPQNHNFQHECSNSNLPSPAKGAEHDRSPSQSGTRSPRSRISQVQITISQRIRHSRGRQRSETKALDGTITQTEHTTAPSTTITIDLKKKTRESGGEQVAPSPEDVSKGVDSDQIQLARHLTGEALNKALRRLSSSNVISTLDTMQNRILTSPVDGEMVAVGRVARVMTEGNVHVSSSMDIQHQTKSPLTIKTGATPECAAHPSPTNSAYSPQSPEPMMPGESGADKDRHQVLSIRTNLKITETPTQAYSSPTFNSPSPGPEPNSPSTILAQPQSSTWISNLGTVEGENKVIEDQQRHTRGLLDFRLVTKTTLTIGNSLFPRDDAQTQPAAALPPVPDNVSPDAAGSRPQTAQSVSQTAADTFPRDITITQDLSLDITGLPSRTSPKIREKGSYEDAVRILEDQQCQLSSSLEIQTITRTSLLVSSPALPAECAGPSPTPSPFSGGAEEKYVEGKDDVKVHMECTTTIQQPGGILRQTDAGDLSKAVSPTQREIAYAAENIPPIENPSTVPAINRQEGEAPMELSAFSFLPSLQDTTAQDQTKDNVLTSQDLAGTTQRQELSLPWSDSRESGGVSEENVPNAGTMQQGEKAGAPEEPVGSPESAEHEEVPFGEGVMSVEAVDQSETKFSAAQPNVTSPRLPSEGEALDELGFSSPSPEPTNELPDLTSPLSGETFSYGNSEKVQSVEDLPGRNLTLTDNSPKIDDGMGAETKTLHFLSHAIVKNEYVPLEEENGIDSPEQILIPNLQVSTEAFLENEEGVRIPIEEVTDITHITSELIQSEENPEQITIRHQVAMGPILVDDKKFEITQTIEATGTREPDITEDGQTYVRLTEGQDIVSHLAIQISDREDVDDQKALKQPEEGTVTTTETEDKSKAQSTRQEAATAERGLTETRESRDAEEVQEQLKEKTASPTPQYEAGVGEIHTAASEQEMKEDEEVIENAEEEVTEQPVQKPVTPTSQSEAGQDVIHASASEQGMMDNQEDIEPIKAEDMDQASEKPVSPTSQSEAGQEVVHTGASEQGKVDGQEDFESIKGEDMEQAAEEPVSPVPQSEAEASEVHASVGEQERREQDFKPIEEETTEKLAEKPVSPTPQCEAGQEVVRASVSEQGQVGGQEDIEPIIGEDTEQATGRPVSPAAQSEIEASEVHTGISEVERAEGQDFELSKDVVSEQLSEKPVSPTLQSEAEVAEIQAAASEQEKRRGQETTEPAEEELAEQLAEKPVSPTLQSEAGTAEVQAGTTEQEKRKDLEGVESTEDVVNEQTAGVTAASPIREEKVEITAEPSAPISEQEGARPESQTIIIKAELIMTVSSTAAEAGVESAAVAIGLETNVVEEQIKKVEEGLERSEQAEAEQADIDKTPEKGGQGPAKQFESVISLGEQEQNKTEEEGSEIRPTLKPSAQVTEVPGPTETQIKPDAFSAVGEAVEQQKKQEQELAEGWSPSIEEGVSNQLPSTEQMPPDTLAAAETIPFTESPKEGGKAGQITAVEEENTVPTKIDIDATQAEQIQETQEERSAAETKGPAELGTEADVKMDKEDVVIQPRAPQTTAETAVLQDGTAAEDLAMAPVGEPREEVTTPGPMETQASSMKEAEHEQEGESKLASEAVEEKSIHEAPAELEAVPSAEPHEEVISPEPMETQAGSMKEAEHEQEGESKLASEAVEEKSIHEAPAELEAIPSAEPHEEVISPEPMETQAGSMKEAEHEQEGESKLASEAVEEKSIHEAPAELEAVPSAEPHEEVISPEPMETQAGSMKEAEHEQEGESKLASEAVEEKSIHEAPAELEAVPSAEPHEEVISPEPMETQAGSMKEAEHEQEGESKLASEAVEEKSIHEAPAELEAVPSAEPHEEVISPEPMETQAGSMKEAEHEQEGESKLASEAVEEKSIHEAPAELEAVPSAEPHEEVISPEPMETQAGSMKEAEHEQEGESKLASEAVEEKSINEVPTEEMKTKADTEFDLEQLQLAESKEPTEEIPGVTEEDNRTQSPDTAYIAQQSGYPTLEQIQLEKSMSIDEDQEGEQREEGKSLVTDITTEMTIKIRPGEPPEVTVKSFTTATTEQATANYDQILPETLIQEQTIPKTDQRHEQTEQTGAMFESPTEGALAGEKVSRNENLRATVGEETLERETVGQTEGKEQLIIGAVVDADEGRISVEAALQGSLAPEGHMNADARGMVVGLREIDIQNPQGTEADEQIAQSEAPELVEVSQSTVSTMRKQVDDVRKQAEGTEGKGTLEDQEQIRVVDASDSERMLRELIKYDTTLDELKEKIRAMTPEERRKLHECIELLIEEGALITTEEEAVRLNSVMKILSELQAVEQFRPEQMESVAKSLDGLISLSDEERTVLVREAKNKLLTQADQLSEGEKKELVDLIRRLEAMNGMNDEQKAAYIAQEKSALKSGQLEPESRKQILSDDERKRLETASKSVDDLAALSNEERSILVDEMRQKLATKSEELTEGERKELESMIGMMEEMNRMTDEERTKFAKDLKANLITTEVQGLSETEAGIQPIEATSNTPGVEGEPAAVTAGQISQIVQLGEETTIIESEPVSIKARLTATVSEDEVKVKLNVQIRTPEQTQSPKRMDSNEIQQIKLTEQLLGMTNDELAVFMHDTQMQLEDGALTLTDEERARLEAALEMAEQISGMTKEEKEALAAKTRERLQNVEVIPAIESSGVMSPKESTVSGAETRPDSEQFDISGRSETTEGMGQTSSPSGGVPLSPSNEYPEGWKSREDGIPGKVVNVLQPAFSKNIESTIHDSNPTTRVDVKPVGEIPTQSRTQATSKDGTEPTMLSFEQRAETSRRRRRGVRTQEDSDSLDRHFTAMMGGPRRPIGDGLRKIRSTDCRFMRPTIRRMQRAERVADALDALLLETIQYIKQNLTSR
ncbi:unnamed protein product [Calicophoron daubneyi]|uniref:Uncharacterized protein n=1 Tax=Calicophoron daubneyi TaxID=300641 RepID=A0AAV2SZF5_CALDB